jgi:5-methylcytosine-specific restriction endonuclease McrA
MKPKTLRKLLAARDGLFCHWCQRPLRTKIKTAPNGKLADDFPTVDHLVRVIHGGKLTPENTVLACKKCNTGRHAPGWEPKIRYAPAHTPNDQS